MAAEPERVATTQHENLSDKLSVPQLEAALAALREAGAHHFDAPRFHFIQVTVQRAGVHSSAVAERLAARAEAALAEYQQRYLATRQQAAQSLDKVCEQFPESAASLQQLFDEGKLRQFEGLLVSLQRPGKQRSLGPLLERLQRRGDHPVSGTDTAGLELLLLQQEQQALAAISSASEVARSVVGGMRELCAARHFRKSQARHSASRLLAQAVAAGPQNSGPLNPQMLAIRSLEALQGLSPAYVRHMVSYIDTVLRLGNAEQQPASGSRSRSRRRPRSCV